METIINLLASPLVGPLCPVTRNHLFFPPFIPTRGMIAARQGHFGLSSILEMINSNGLIMLLCV